MRALLLSCIALILLLGPSSAQAHRVNVFAWVEGDSVHVETEFSRGTPVQGGIVEVRDTRTGEVVAKGTTDEAGAFEFSISDAVRMNPSDLKIVVVAGQGHQGSWVVRAQDYAGKGAGGAGETAAAGTPTAAHGGESRAIAGESGQLDAEAIAKLEARVARTVERTLDERLAPLTRAVTRMQDEAGPSAADIFGGIGYLVGLAGVFAYAQSRRKQ